MSGDLLPTAELRGKTALVTGASRGIGLEVARLLAEAGAWVAMTARGEDALSRAAAEVGGHAFPADVSARSEVEVLGRRLEAERGGAPDLVVNAAGAFSIVPLAETDPDDFDAQLGANLRGPFLVIRAFLPAMLARGSGHLLSVGSVAGRVAMAGNGAYAASKFGLRGLHEVLAEEVRGTGVRATLVEPAATDTPLWDPLDPDARDYLPSRRSMLRPEEVARAVLFALAQPQCVEVSLLALRSARR